MPTVQTKVVRRASERGYTKSDWLESHHTFSFDTFYDENFINFSALRVINEDTVQPGKGFRTHSHRDMEIVTLVLDGALEHKDSLGTGSVIRAGEIQRMSAGTGITHSEFNHSPTELVHFVQIWIFPEANGLTLAYEQKAIAHAHVGQWREIASRTGSDTAIQVQQDVSLWLADLEPGQALTYDIPEGRQVWVQMLQGKITLEGEAYAQGDGIGLTMPGTIRFQANTAAKILLFNLKRSSEIILGDDV